MQQQPDTTAPIPAPAPDSSMSEAQQEMIDELDDLLENWNPNNKTPEEVALHIWPTKANISSVYLFCITG